VEGNCGRGQGSPKTVMPEEEEKEKEDGEELGGEEEEGE
jgi:hypothetical protein